MQPLYDLTGVNPAFKVEERPFYMFVTGQRIDFGEAVYPDSIVVHKVLSNGTLVRLTRNTDWFFDPATDTDQQSMSDAKIQDRNFNTTLAKSIQMLIKNVSQADVQTHIALRITYQALRRNIMEVASEEPSGPTCTPSLLKAIIYDVDYLMNTKNPIGQAVSSLEGKQLVLEEDVGTYNSQTGKIEHNPLNFIENEVHPINTTGVKAVIRPGAGSFYPQDLKLTVRGTGEVLTLDVDYKIIGLNIPKTSVTNFTYGVYDYIILTTAITGDVLVTYRAFGGMVTQLDINALRDALLEISTMLQSNQLITKDNLGATQTIQEIINRLTIMERYLRYWPIASFISNPKDQNDHWYNLAFMHKDAWYDAIIPTNAIGQFRISYAQKSIVYDISIRVQIDNQGNELLGYSLACVDGDSYVDFHDYTNWTPPVGMKLRIVWVRGANNEKYGVVLQMAVNTPDHGDSFMICDRTGYDSNWHLYAANNDLRDPADWECAMPAPSITWYGFWPVTPTGNQTPEEAIIASNPPAEVVYANVTGYGIYQQISTGTWRAATGVNSELHHVAERFICPESGMLVFAGNIACTDLMDDQQDAQHTYQSLPAMFDVDVKSAKKIVFSFYDKLAARYISIANERIDDEVEWAGSVMFYAEDLCSIYFRLQNDDSGVTMLDVCTRLGSNSINNDRFDLRQIVLFY